jgi:hypothetical protein
MFDNNAIRELQEEAAVRAAEEGLEPFVLYDEESALEDVRHATNLGNHVPEGWTVARYEDYAEGLTRCAEVSQDNCAGEFDGELCWWVSKGFESERGEYDVRTLAEDAPKLVRQAACRGVALGVAICEEGQFQLYLRFFEKPYLSTHQPLECW